MTLNHLTVHRKADLAEIADALCAIATQHGAAIERRDGGRYGREVDLDFSHNGVGAGVWVNAELGDGHHLISWYNEGPGPCRHFAGAFNVAIGDLLQFSPHHKATTCAKSWDDLAERLRAGLELARHGRAFNEQRRLTPIRLDWESRESA